jgi:hypothetical protein
MQETIQRLNAELLEYKLGRIGVRAASKLRPKRLGASVN